MPCVKRLELSAGKSSLLATWSLNASCLPNIAFSRLQSQAEHSTVVNYTGSIAKHVTEYLLTDLNTNTRYRVCLVVHGNALVKSASLERVCRDVVTMTNVSLLLGILVGIMLAVLLCVTICILCRLAIAGKTRKQSESTTTETQGYEQAVWSWLQKSQVACPNETDSGLNEDTADAQKRFSASETDTDCPLPWKPAESAVLSPRTDMQRLGSAIHKVMVEMRSGKHRKANRSCNEAETVILCNLQIEMDDKSACVGVSPGDSLAQCDAHFASNNDADATVLPLTSTTLLLHDIQTGCVGPAKGNLFWSTVDQFELTTENPSATDGVFVEFIETF